MIGGAAEAVRAAASVHPHCGSARLRTVDSGGSFAQRKEAPTTERALPPSLRAPLVGCWRCNDDDDDDDDDGDGEAIQHHPVRDQCAASSQIARSASFW